MHTPTLPLPRNGLNYGVGELIQLVTQYLKVSSKHSKILRKVLDPLCTYRYSLALKRRLNVLESLYFEACGLRFATGKRKRDESESDHYDD